MMQADLDRSAPAARKIRGIAQVAREPLDRRTAPRAAARGRLLEARPLGEQLAALLHANAVAEIVAQHDVEARQQHAREKLRELDQTRTRPPARRKRSCTLP